MTGPYLIVPLPVKRGTFLLEDWQAGSKTIPESWQCVDCGRDTAPGVPGRSAMGEEIAKHGKCEVAYNKDCEIYTVRKSVWKKAGMGDWDGCLCIGCLEKRLGRRLKPRDFEPDNELNDLVCTPRLRKRRGTEY